MASSPTGIFDSGVGGLSVYREVRRLLPHEDLIYFADQAHVPYGHRSLEEVRAFSEAISSFLIDQGAKTIVVACNTASAAALRHLRQTFKGTPFVGMEPAVKPAAERTRNRVIGVIATPVTFQGELFASLVDRYAQGVRVLTGTCAGLVEEIERGNLDTPEVRRMLRDCLEPLLSEGIDSLVIGCTHYPFVIPAIRAVVGDGIEIIDASPAVARQVQRVLGQAGLTAPGTEPGSDLFLTSGERPQLERALMPLTGLQSPVHTCKWTHGALQRLD